MPIFELLPKTQSYYVKICEIKTHAVFLSCSRLSRLVLPFTKCKCSFIKQRVHAHRVCDLLSISYELQQFYFVSSFMPFLDRYATL